MSEPNRYYVLSLNARQARTVINALDAYARSFMGQINFALDDTYHDACARAHREGRQFDYEKYYEAVQALKVVAFPELHPHASYGATSPEVNETARVAIDIHDVLRNKMAWIETPEGGCTVNFDVPMHFSEEPLPKCRAETPEKPSGD